MKCVTPKAVLLSIALLLSSHAYAAPNIQNGKAIDQAKCYACHRHYLGHETQRPRLSPGLAKA